MLCAYPAMPHHKMSAGIKSMFYLKLNIQHVLHCLVKNKLLLYCFNPLGWSWISLKCCFFSAFGRYLSTFDIQYNTKMSHPDFRDNYPTCVSNAFL